jgi:cellobiose phosphorylase
MKSIWRYTDSGNFAVDNVGQLPQPLVHMLANSPNYFSICDNFLRGYSGFDYTRMFGEFDGPNFPKGNGRFFWIRPDGGKKPWLVNNYDLTSSQTQNAGYEMGLGWAKFSGLSKEHNLSASVTVFVPLNDMCEICMVEITNNSRNTQKLDFIPVFPIFGGSRAYVEYHRDVVRLYNKSEVTNHIEILPGLEWVEGSTDKSDICYFMSAETETGKKGNRFYSDRETFLGANNMWLKPDAILKNEAPKAQCFGKEAVGAIEFQKITVPAGKTVKFVVVTGISHGKKETLAIIKKYSYAKSVKAFDDLKKFWTERTSRVVIETGNKDFSNLWNNWWCYQLSMRYWFGNTAHPQFDYGSDFSGWRDFWQDMMAATVIDPKGLKERTLRTLEGIRLDGTNATRFFARTKEFGSDEVNGLWCDHPYWTTQTVMLLVNFLGDYNFLFQNGIAYFKDCYQNRGEFKDISWKKGHIEKQKDATGVVYKGTIIEHLLVQLLTMFYDVGNHNLLKQKRADWNDAVDQVKGENVTYTLGLALDLNELSDLLEKVTAKLGISEIEVFKELEMLIEKKPKADIPAKTRQAKLAKYLAVADKAPSGKKVKIKVSDLLTDMRFKAKVSIDNANKIAFNGSYYSGYIFDSDRPVDTIFKKGALSKKKPTTSDYEMMLMPQTWSLVSGAADKVNAADTVINSVLTHLADKKVGGLKLNYPPYTKFDKTIGRITGFAAGTKENNAIFCHANMFFIWALLRRNMADEAFKRFSGVNPLSHKPEIIRTGPWIPEYYVSSDNPNIGGRGEYPLLTGSVGWSRYLFQNFFFGVRGELEGLRIDPKLPAAAEFKNSSLTIKFRGAQYKISFLNDKLIKNAKVISITVDGKVIDGNLIKPFTKGTHKVVVRLGK